MINDCVETTSDESQTSKKRVLLQADTAYGTLTQNIREKKNILDGGRGATTGLLDLDLDVGNGTACAGQICGAGVGVLGVVVGDGGLDGILSEHGAVN